ncbi:MAG: substrate-binding domain-containing protein [Armatimonadaceae bacterium]
MPTIRQIAKMCNVSPMTVSFVLNNKTDQVSEETRERVLRTMRETGYRPRTSTRSHPGVGVRTIGIAVGRTVRPSESGSYFSNIFDGIIQATERVGYSTLLFHSGLFHEDPYRSIRTYFDGRCDGLIVLAPNRDMPLVPALAERGVPFVLIGDQGDGENIPSVDVNNISEAEAIVDYLVDLGHRRIAFIGGAEQFTRVAWQRHEGYRRAMVRHSLPIPQGYEIAPLRSESLVYEAVSALIRRNDIPRPTAFFAWNDSAALRALMALQDANLRIPAEVSLIGFDDDSRVVQAQPSLTTVRQPYREIAARAVEMLARWVDEGEVCSEQVFLPSRLIVRDSTAAPPAQGKHQEAVGIKR